MLISYMRFFLLLSTLLLSSNILSKTQITVYSYHPDPPYIIAENPKVGNSFKLVKFLNDQANNEYIFNLEVVPRKRLDLILKTDKNIIVPWTTPKWFKDKDEKKFKWSISYYKSSNILISNIKNPIKDNNVQGLNLAGLRGGKWPMFTHLIKTGQLIKTEVPKYISILHMVERGHVNGGILPLATLNYYHKRKLVGKNIYIPKDPLTSQDLKFLIKGSKKLQSSLNATLKKLKDSKLFQ